MSSKEPPSELVAAVQEFDAELSRFGQLTESLVRASLSGEQNLERAITKLGQLSECEEKLGTSAQALMASLNAARARQEVQAKIAVERAKEIQGRNAQMTALLVEVRQIGEEVSGLNDVAQKIDAATSVSSEGGSVPVADVENLNARVGALAERARLVSSTAHEHDFPEIAKQTHALSQKLLAMQSKLTGAARPAAS